MHVVCRGRHGWIDSSRWLVTQTVVTSNLNSIGNHLDTDHRCLNLLSVLYPWRCRVPWSLQRPRQYSHDVMVWAPCHWRKAHPRVRSNLHGCAQSSWLDLCTSHCDSLLAHWHGLSLCTTISIRLIISFYFLLMDWARVSAALLTF